MTALVDHVFGIRHLSAAGAAHLAQLLDEVQPTAVCVEGPAGIEREIAHLVHADTRPPVALLAFTKERPIRTMSYPLTRYSPEWVACRWALAHGRELVFMDLPADVFLGLGAARERAQTPAPDDASDAGATDEADALLRFDPLEALARRAGGTDLETWWERTFEHLASAADYMAAAHALGEGMREVEQRPAWHTAETILREAFMRRVLRETLARGHDRSRVVAVCGAFHTPVLTDAEPSMSDAEVASLPRLAATVTLVPYSYERLHTRSGYGAGNVAPAYFEALYDELVKGRPERVAVRFLSRVARTMRRSGNPKAPAQVIDAVRLARALAAASDSPVVTLGDLRAAAVTCLGEGDARVVASALDKVETGDAIGRLPDGVSRTALQDDFRRQVRELKLEKVLRAGAEPLELDLREDRRAKSVDAAFLDRRRSTFLHRVGACGLALAQAKATGQANASWKEHWLVTWSEAFEVALAQRSLVGDSVAGVAAYELSLRLAACRGAGEAACVLEVAARCELADALEAARAKVQAVAVDDDSLPSIASAVDALLAVTRFGGVRHVDPEPLWPLVAQLFLRGALLLPDAVQCDDSARAGVRDGLVALARAASQEPARLAVSAFDAAVRDAALSDRGDAYLAGAATALGLERLLLEDDELGGALSRRLSAGTDPGAAGSYFEGLAGMNRSALFSRPVLWQMFSRYVDALDGDQFLHALVPLRRAFADFSPGEIRRVVDQLAQAWGGGRAALAKSVEQPLSDADLAALADGLGDLDL